MAKYKKREDGRFYTLVNTGKYSEDGQPVRIPVYGTSSRDLEYKVGEIKTDLRRGTYADDCNITFGQYAEIWQRTHKCQGMVADATIQNYKNIIKNHIELIKDTRLMALTKSNIQEQVNAKSEYKEIRRMLLITIKQVLECAIEDGLLYRNVARTIKTPAAPKREKRPLTNAEKEAIKTCDFTSKERFFVSTLYITGVRPEEILALTKSSINLSKKELTVSSALSWKGGKKIKEPKSKAGYRTIPLPDWYIEESTPYLKSVQSIYLFPGANGDLISQSVYKYFWREIRNKINMQLGGTATIYSGGKVKQYGINATDITPYVFRHNYATLLYYQGVDIKEAQRLLGHSNIKITLEIYTHLIENKKDLKEKINQIAL